MLLRKKKKVIGIDIGRASLKAVLLQLNPRRREVLVQDYAILDLKNDEERPLGESIRALVNSLSTRCKEVAIAVWPEGSQVKMFKHPANLQLVRQMLRVNSQRIVHEDLSGSVVDCVELHHVTGEEEHRYVGCSIPKDQFGVIEAACSYAKLKIKVLQAGPLALFNAFDISQPEVAHHRAYLLVDIGSSTTTIIGGFRGDLWLARSINWGTAELTHRLISDGALNPEDTLEAFSADDIINVAALRAAISSIARDIASSVTYIKADGNVDFDSVYISGAVSYNVPFLQTLSEEIGTLLHRNTVADELSASDPNYLLKKWNPVRTAKAKEKTLKERNLLNKLAHLPAAAGAGFQYLL